MPRLFTTLWPAASAIDALSAELAQDADWPRRGWRAIPPSRWHVTLCYHGEAGHHGEAGYHGEAEPGVLARRLDARAGGARAPWLRLAGAVSFPRVAAVAVTTPGQAESDALAALVRAAGAEPSTHRAHITLARTSRRGDAPPPDGPMARHQGLWWRPSEVCLVRSEQVSGAPRYTVLHRVALDADPSSPPRSRRPASAHR